MLSSASTAATSRCEVVHLASGPGGVPKRSIRSAEVTPLGLVGDAHRQSMHGGPERALCLWAIEIIDRLRVEGHVRIAPGSTGENITTRGLAWASLAAGMQLQLGDVIAELTALTVPCRVIMNQFADRKFGRIRVPELSRWYARVIRTGVLHVGDPIMRL